MYSERLSIYKINDKSGNQLGLLKVPSMLDIIDVQWRAKAEHGEDSEWRYPVYLGDIDTK